MTLHCVTLNTGFDETLRVRGFAFGGVGDLVSSSSSPSGKGVNAARAAKALGAPDVVVHGFVGEHDLEAFAAPLRAEGIGTVLTPLGQPTRRNVTIADADGGFVAAHVRAPGFRLGSDAALRALLAELEQAVRAGDVVSLHGSLPEGCGDDAWLRIARAAVAGGAQACADVSGEALLRLLGQVSLSCCKPNHEEASVLGPACNARGDAPALLRSLRGGGVRLPVVTWGAEGLIAASDGRVVRALAPSRPATLVGAGDVAMGALLVALAREDDPLDALRLAAAASAVHVEGHGVARLAELTRERMAQVRLDDWGAGAP